MLVTTMRAERENDHRARHDALTGLSNRVGLDRAVATRLATKDARFALLYLDLDGFKSVNDTHGHARGDQLLRMVAGRLSGALRDGDVAARIGGDEFVVLAGTAEPAAARALGERLLTAIATTYDLGDNISTTVGVSIGVALAPEHGADPTGLLAAADAALYQAKSGGKLRCAMASLDDNVAHLRRLHAEATASPADSRVA
jgi:diguanylate cyclase (GGDEF)-like protein